MTVSSELNRKEYAGNGVTTAFATSPVVFFDSGDLDVYVVSSAGVATLKTITTHYTVTGGDGSTGTVTMVTAPASGETLVIVRTLDVTQSTDFVNNDSSDAEVAEDTIDRLTMIAQQIDAKVDRSFRLADSDVSGASTEIPTPAGTSLIGWNTAGTALQNYSTSTLSSALTTAFTLTLLDDTTAAEARTTLGFPDIAAKGDLVVGSADDTLTKLAVGTDGYDLNPVSGATSGLAWVSPLAYNIKGGYIDWTVSGNVLTVAVKTTAGNDPSATEPVFFGFRSVTADNGTLTWIKVTAATSIAINATALLGTSNSTAFRLWGVAFNDGGTVRLAIINCLSGTSTYPLAGWGIASATQETDGADSAHVFYSDGAAVTSKAYSVLGYATWETGLATAGTWSAGPTRKQLFGPGVPLPGQQIQSASGSTGAVSTTTTAIPADDTIPQITEGAEIITVAITPSSAANVLDVSAVGNMDHGSSDVSLITALFQDATANALAAATTRNTITAWTKTIPLRHRFLAGTSASTTLRLRGGSSTAGTVTFNGTASARILGGVLFSKIHVAEIMA